MTSMLVTASKQSRVRIAKRAASSLRRAQSERAAGSHTQRDMRAFYRVLQPAGAAYTPDSCGGQAASTAQS